ncbi:MAG: hypothetical protein V4603_01760, partial [Pseudomonadota bacterium]
YDCARPDFRFRQVMERNPLFSEPAHLHEANYMDNVPLPDYPSSQSLNPFTFVKRIWEISSLYIRAADNRNYQLL